MHLFIVAKVEEGYFFSYFLSQKEECVGGKYKWPKLNLAKSFANNGLRLWEGNVSRGKIICFH